MPVNLENSEIRPATVRGLYGYEIDGVFSELPHAAIYRGRRKMDGLKVLIKLFRDLAIPDWGANWFQHDYHISHGLRSDYVATPLAFEHTDLGPAIIYVDDGKQPLEKHAATGPLSLESALTMTSSAAEAVAALHKDGFIHCNLNTTTIWFDSESGRAVLSEFGSAQRLSESAAGPSYTSEIADVRFVSPEQTGRVQNTVDRPTDIYSLGIILYRLLTGFPPFDGTDVLHIIDGHVARQPAFPADLPEGLVRVLLKALAKGPDARYLSVDGFIADLLDCHTLWRSTGTISDFEPGRHDASGILHVSRQLYGRDRETAVLMEKVKSAKRGPPAMLLVKGAPGVGKSSLLGQTENFVRSQSGRFISGKFDQYKRNVPYLALVQAFQQLIAQILCGSKDDLQRWRERIHAAVGDNARVIIDGLPDLELITGPQPPVRALPPIQARNRLNRVFAKLIQCIASRDALLCIFLDDLQWVDVASLALLSHVLTDPDTKNVLIVGAYRDNEVGPSHPLETTLGTLKQEGVDVQILELTELSETDLVQLVRDTFAVSAAEAKEFAQSLYWKSGGNPLYLTQFLPYLHHAGLISFNYRSGKWNWDLPRIKQEGVTQDVLDLLHKRLRSLPQDTRALLATAACLGSSFDVGKLTVAAERSLSEVLRCLTIGTREALLVPIQGEPATDHLFSTGLTPESRFRFLHDRVQQAAFDCIPEVARKAFRLQIGLRLMAHLSPEVELVPQLDVLNNLNATWELITEETLRDKLARLNLVAGRKARQALAYQDALGYISVGLALLKEDAWRSNYDLAFGLHSEALECEYLTANFERADQLFKTLIANASSKLDKARIFRIKILLDNSEERYEDVIKVGISALKLFGIRYRRRPSNLDLLIQLLLVRLRLHRRTPQDLLKANPLEDPEKLAALRMLTDLIPTTYLFDKKLFLFTALKAVNYSLRHGNAPISAVGFIVYGLIRCAGMDDYKGGYEFGRMAIELAERSKDPSIICKVIWIFAAMILSWRDPIDESFPLFERARRLALDVGEHQYANYIIISIIFAMITSGKPLHDILRVCEEYLPFVLHSKDQAHAEFVTMCRNHCLALQGKTTAPYSLNDGTYDEIASELRLQRTGNLTFVFYQLLLRLKLACRFGRFSDALALSEKGEAVIHGAYGFPQVAEHYLYRGLAAAAALSNPGSKFPLRYRKALRHCRKRLHLFAANSPHNFLHYEALLDAEAARISGHPSTALKKFERAIELAEAEGYTHLVGLANERAALCCLAHGQRRMAGWFLSGAKAAYEKWGATEKAAALVQEYGALLSTTAMMKDSASRPGNVFVRHPTESFDVAAALQASRIISSGETSDRVLTHLMQVIRIQAGAETAQLLVTESDRLRLEAKASVESGGVTLFTSTANESMQASFSPAVVNYVIHSGSELLLRDARSDSRFAQCPYLADRHPKSLLCCPIRHQGEVLGVIYLEHTGISGAFDGRKLEWLHLLATEVGLTVWSARMSRYRDYVHKFAPAAVAREIDANPASPNLDARDCDVSILFGDLAGYTRMSERMERRQLDALMNRVFTRFVDEIHRYEGTLLEIRGDELFVMFADEDRSKHVWKAGRAALAISQAAADLREELSGVEIPIVANMGINAGIASVGLKAVDASSGSRWRYGASGAVVNIAARVRELARDGSILLSADAAARVQDDFTLEDMGEHALKNVMNRVRVYRLIGERASGPMASGCG